MFFLYHAHPIFLVSSGTAFGVLSSVFVSLNSIFTKTALDHVGGDKWRLAYYNNVNACIIFLPLIFAFGEDQTIVKYAVREGGGRWKDGMVHGAWHVAASVCTCLYMIHISLSQELLSSGYFWFMMNIAGVLGFAIGIATVMQINYTCKFDAMDMHIMPNAACRVIAYVSPRIVACYHFISIIMSRHVSTHAPPHIVASP